MINYKNYVNQELAKYWVSIEDELPENGETVLILFGSRDQDVALFKGTYSKYAPEHSYAWGRGAGWQIWEDVLSQITHWMKLPPFIESKHPDNHTIFSSLEKN